MFSPADAHIVVCDLERLPGPEAVVRVADCTRMIAKALREGEHQALLLQVRLKDNARAARPGVWPAAAHPADLELQLAVPTTVYHWPQAFHDLRWRGKPDRQIGSTHPQAWLQADAQRDAVRSLGPAPATRALDAAAPGHALAPQTVPLVNLPFEPANQRTMLQETGIATRAQELHVAAALRDKGYTPFFSSRLAVTGANSTSRGGGLLTAVSSKYVAEQEVLSFTEIVPGKAAALEIRTDGGGLILINVHGPQAGCSPLAGRAAFWADIQMYATARSLVGRKPVVIAGDTNVYMDATSNPATEHFGAGWEACAFRRATAGGEEDMTPTLHPSRHRMATFLVKEPLLPWSLLESI